MFLLLNLNVYLPTREANNNIFPKYSWKNPNLNAIIRQTNGIFRELYHKHCFYLFLFYTQLPVERWCTTIRSRQLHFKACVHVFIFNLKKPLKNYGKYLKCSSGCRYIPIFVLFLLLDQRFTISRGSWNRII